MIAHGFVHKYGDNIDTDVIIPARYLNTANHKELAAHCMEDIDKSFVTKVKAGDIMVGGANFGCGSSREHAPIAIKESGISVVIAATFARIFYRNSINIGLAILECPEASEKIESELVIQRNKQKEQSAKKELIFIAHSKNEAKLNDLRNHHEKLSDQLWNDYELTYSSAANFEAE